MATILSNGRIGNIQQFMLDNLSALQNTPGVTIDKSGLVKNGTGAPDDILGSKTASALQSVMAAAGIDAKSPYDQAAQDKLSKLLEGKGLDSAQVQKFVKDVGIALNDKDLGAYCRSFFKEGVAIAKDKPSESRPEPVPVEVPPSTGSDDPEGSMRAETKPVYEEYNVLWSAHKPTTSGRPEKIDMMQAHKSPPPDLKNAFLSSINGGNPVVLNASQKYGNTMTIGRALTMERVGSPNLEQQAQIERVKAQYDAHLKTAGYSSLQEQIVELRKQQGDLDKKMNYDREMAISSARTIDQYRFTTLTGNNIPNDEKLEYVARAGSEGSIACRMSRDDIDLIKTQLADGSWQKNPHLSGMSKDAVNKVVEGYEKAAEKGLCLADKKISFEYKGQMVTCSLNEAIKGEFGGIDTTELGYKIPLFGQSKDWTELQKAAVSAFDKTMIADEQKLGKTTYADAINGYHDAVAKLTSDHAPPKEPIIGKYEDHLNNEVRLMDNLRYGEHFVGVNKLGQQIASLQEKADTIKENAEMIAFNVNGSAPDKEMVVSAPAHQAPLKI